MNLLLGRIILLPSLILPAQCPVRLCVHELRNWLCPTPCTMIIVGFVHLISTVFLHVSNPRPHSTDQQDANEHNTSKGTYNLQKCLQDPQKCQNQDPIHGKADQLGRNRNGQNRPHGLPRLPGDLPEHVLDEPHQQVQAPILILIAAVLVIIIIPVHRVDGAAPVPGIPHQIAPAASLRETGGAPPGSAEAGAERGGARRRKRPAGRDREAVGSDGSAREEAGSGCSEVELLLELELQHGSGGGAAFMEVEWAVQEILARRRRRRRREKAPKVHVEGAERCMT